MRRNVDAKLTRRAQDVDDEDIIQPQAEDDYIEPLAGENIETAISGAVSSRGGSSREHVQRVRSKRSSILEDRPTISVGRGGAGNIISPVASRKNQTRKKKNSKKAEEKGVWSKFKNLFS